MTTDPEPIAKMSHRSGDGPRWLVYVVTRVGNWEPRTYLPCVDGIPSVADRTAALAKLGYTPVTPADRWDWVECGSGDSGPCLIAETRVVRRNADAPLPDINRHI